MGRIHGKSLLSLDSPFIWIFMENTKKYSLVKPTLETPFHIDFAWWKQNDNNWRIHLQSCLCAEHQVAISTMDSDTIDWVDPVTAEVAEVDALQHLLISHCSKETGFITDFTTLVDAVFRAFLANGNVPLSPVQLETAIHKPAITILRTLSGPKVYKGIRPA